MAKPKLKGNATTIRLPIKEDEILNQRAKKLNLSRGELASRALTACMRMSEDFMPFANNIDLPTWPSSKGYKVGDIIDTPDGKIRITKVFPEGKPIIESVMLGDKSKVHITSH